MSFSNQSEQNGKVFNNADSFAMAFDKAWESLKPIENKDSLTQEEKISMTLKKIDNHPFLQEFPAKAKEVALFRIRLLNLA